MAECSLRNLKFLGSNAECLPENSAHVLIYNNSIGSFFFTGIHHYRLVSNFNQDDIISFFLPRLTSPLLQPGPTRHRRRAVLPTRPTHKIHRHPPDTKVSDCDLLDTQNKFIEKNEDKKGSFASLFVRPTPCHVK